MCTSRQSAPLLSRQIPLWVKVVAGQPVQSIQFGVRGLALLKKIEGLRTKPYDDQTGKDISAWCAGATIGYGHLISVGEWDAYKTGMSEVTAEQLLVSDLRPFTNEIKAKVKIALSQNQFDALVLLTFNIGKSAFSKPSVLKLVNDPNAHTPYSTLEQAWKAWNKSQGVVNKGLANRRNAEWNIFKNGIYAGW